MPKFLDKRGRKEIMYLRAFRFTGKQCSFIERQSVVTGVNMSEQLRRLVKKEMKTDKRRKVAA